MTKGISIKFSSYEDTVPKALRLIRLDEELKKYDSIVLKPFIRDSKTPYSSPEFIESVLKFCNTHKKSGAGIFIAEGSEGEETIELMESQGFRTLAEKYSVGLLDLNNTELEETANHNLLKFESIMYPKILKNSFVISLPVLFQDDELEVVGSLANMIGAFPSSEYSGFFSRKKSKIRKWPIKYSIHDIVTCKMPNLSIIDASSKGHLLVGQPLEVDKQSAKLLGLEWKEVSHLKLIAESIELSVKKAEAKQAE